MIISCNPAVFAINAFATGFLSGAKFPLSTLFPKEGCVSGAGLVFYSLTDAYGNLMWTLGGLLWQTVVKI